MADEEGGTASPVRVSRRGVLVGGAATVAALGAGVGIGRSTAVDDGDRAGGRGVEVATSKLKFERVAVEPLPRSQHATAVTSDGLILCIGGVSANGELASCQVYDPESEEWYDAAPLASPRSWHSATPLRDGRVLVLGGFDGTSALSIASVFDPAKDEWSRAKPLASPRYMHAATALPDGRVVLTGGFNGGPLVAAEIYELEA